MTSEKQDFRTLVRLFIENHATQFDLNIYHISLLKVIAEYCDMPLGYCCLSFSNLCKYSRMSEAQRRKVTTYLKDNNLIEQSYVKNKPRHEIGIIIVKKMTAPIERLVAESIHNLAPDRSNRAW